MRAFLKFDGAGHRLLRRDSRAFRPGSRLMWARGEGQIAPIVLERARALYQRMGVRNPCYFAMDATLSGVCRLTFGDRAKRTFGFADDVKPSPQATAEVMRTPDRP